VVIQLNAFLTSTLNGSKWSASCLNYFTLVEIAPRYPLDRMLSGLQGLEIMLLLGINPNCLVWSKA